MNQHSIEQLKTYDPEAIAHYYRRRPLKVLGRALQVVWSFLGFLLGIFWDRIRKQTHTPQRAEQLRRILTKLGPTYIKVGQALSTRPDLARKDFVEELVKLQDQLPPFDNETAISIIHQELGYHPETIFVSLSENPIAAASLGQVYRGRLHNGDEVAVKVQRPHLLPILTLDLYLIRWGVQWLSPWLPVNLGHDLTLIVDEFGIKLFEEIDYINEGKNAEKFAYNFRDNPNVKVPRIYWDYTSKRVLTLEWIQGYKLNGASSLIAANVDINKFIQDAVEAGLQQLLEHGFFHADPHPGNLFVLSDGRIAYIDFGMMDQLDQYSKETIVDALVHLVNRDYEDLAETFVKLGFLAPGTDINPIIPALEQVLGDIIGERVRDFNIKTVTDRFSDIMYDYPFRVPASFALIIRSVVTQEGLAMSINPEFKLVEMGFPYIAKRLLTGETAELRRRLVEILFKDGKFQWHRLENLIALARRDEDFDILPTAQLALQYLMSEEGTFLRQRLIWALTEDDRLHTKEVQRIWDLIKADLQPARLFDVALGTLADLSPAAISQNSDSLNGSSPGD
ncbi:AarF/ABC1/UbiB kinase family protein [Geitlerinema sp. PCC 9228]|uniref:ABC1 kinase family protein n=1 Tax=Geitlerinema sp. PCC 9228 TaxID=111611 RepID=UPI0008F99470|nr:AarF/ABC1/UbiB kinase family protein [Geitlerinema sp. PCC 9228]